MNQYVRFLIGVQQTQPNKKSLNLRTKNILAKVKELREKEVDTLDLAAGDKDKTYQ